MGDGERYPPWEPEVPLRIAAWLQPTFGSVGASPSQMPPAGGDAGSTGHT
jgi:hypothetical protein